MITSGSNGYTAAAGLQPGHRPGNSRGQSPGARPGRRQLPGDGTGCRAASPRSLSMPEHRRWLRNDLCQRDESVNVFIAVTMTGSVASATTSSLQTDNPVKSVIPHDSQAPATDHVIGSSTASVLPGIWLGYGKRQTIQAIRTRTAGEMRRSWPWMPFLPSMGHDSTISPPVAPFCLKGLIRSAAQEGHLNGPRRDHPRVLRSGRQEGPTRCQRRMENPRRNRTTRVLFIANSDSDYADFRRRHQP